MWDYFCTSSSEREEGGGGGELLHTLTLLYSIIPFSVEYGNPFYLQSDFSNFAPEQPLPILG